MIFRRIIILLLITSLPFTMVVAQQYPDSTEVPVVYKKIENFSARRKFTNAIHGFILKPVSVCQIQGQVTGKSKPSDIYSDFEGKVIRNIHITTLDPFGFSLQDTAVKPGDLISKSGNALHVKTQNLTIRNRLLIRRNDRFDSLLVRESERLIRSQNYVHDVLVRTVLTAQNSDSVDIFIRVADLWSIVPDGALSSSSFTFELADKNLAGLGHTFSNRYKQNFLNGDNAFSAYYYIPNIKNSYINTRLSYTLDEERNFHKGINVERPFFSPLARWAAGASVVQEMKPNWIYKDDTTRLLLKSKYIAQDYWAAAAWQLFRGNSETDRSTKIIFSGRIYNLKYLKKPEEQPDLRDYFTSERFYMAGLGLSSRRYVRQSYIFRFGTTEDVPVGLAVGFVGGYQLKNNERWYWGIRHSWGSFLKWGYFGSNIEYGTFVNASFRTQGTLTVSLNYFSGLFAIGNWKFRQFARPELTVGTRRTSNDRLTINDGYGLNGFNSSVLTGTSRFLFVLQTQSYAPWNLAGFRFGPYMNLSFGMLGNETSGFSRSRLYPQFGIGFLIRNDFLVINNFQLSFAFYPSIHGKGDNIFKANPFRSTDFGFPDFILGKPEVVDFR